MSSATDKPREVTSLEIAVAHVQLSLSVQHLVQEADKLAEQAQEKSALRLLTQSNALRSKSKEIKIQLEKISRQIDEEMEKLK